MRTKIWLVEFDPWCGSVDTVVDYNLTAPFEVDFLFGFGRAARSDADDDATGAFGVDGRMAQIVGIAWPKYISIGDSGDGFVERNARIVDDDDGIDELFEIADLVRRNHDGAVESR